MKISRKSLGVLLEKKEPFSVDFSWARDIVLENNEILERLRPALIVPLVSGTELVGLILLGKKTTGEGFLGDDIDLLRSAGAQVASAIMNARLSQELIETKEVEVFHRFSSFVLHDLKNLVSNLSLVVQNAGEHMSDPQFQKDAFDTVGRSVEKMEELIARLSNGNAIVKPNFEESDLNEVVQEAAKVISQNGLEGKASIQADLGDIPGVLADRHQIEKVLVNLLLNAVEALDDGGLITIKTEAKEGMVILSVSDNGWGMSPDFVEESLFKPFTSTKKKGLGIGLYQCKTIVEAHQGRIEVESEKGVGSTFRIVLPAV